MSWDDNACRLCRGPDDRQYATADDEWAAIRPMPPVPGRTGRSRTADPREAANAARHVLATGRQRRALPPGSPLRSTDRRRFRGRRRDGTLTTELNRLRGSRRKEGRAAAPAGGRSAAASRHARSAS